MSKPAAFVRLAAIALVVLAIFLVQPRCVREQSVSSQTANAGGSLAQYDAYDPEWDEAYHDGYAEEWCDTSEYGEEYVPMLYEDFYDAPDEMWEYSEVPIYEEYYEEYYPAPAYSVQNVYYPEVSYTPGFYSSFAPVGVAAGPNTQATTPTALQPSLEPLRFTLDVVPLGVPSQGLRQTRETPSAPRPVIAPVKAAPPIVVPIDLPYPSCTLEAQQASLAAGNVVFRWSSANAASATLSGVGGVPLQSSYFPVSAPAGARTYTLTVFDASGRSSQCMASVYVETPPQIVYQKPLCSMVAEPARVAAGEATTLSWISINATAAALADIGTVGTAGTHTVFPAASRSYSLTVYGPGGSAVCGADVSIFAQPSPAPIGPRPPTCSLTADPASIFSGASTTLRWSSARAESVALSGIGTVATSGSAVVAPSAAQTFVLSVKGAGGSASCKVEVSVQSAASCIVVCNGITYACAPAATPVAVQCPAEEGGFWNWLKSLFR